LPLLDVRAESPGNRWLLHTPAVCCSTDRGACFECRQGSRCERINSDFNFYSVHNMAAGGPGPISPNCSLCKNCADRP
jgi:hypothetical protein